MKLVNLCPHPVCVKHADGTETIIPQSGLARVSVAYRENGAVEVAGRPVPLIQGVYGGVEGLPEPEAGTCYLVSHMVRMALPRRLDLLSPANIVRDQQGNILACRMFESNLPS
jgi:hypothetical protein